MMNPNFIHDCLISPWPASSMRAVQVWSHSSRQFYSIANAFLSMRKLRCSWVESPVLGGTPVRSKCSIYAHVFWVVHSFYFFNLCPRICLLIWERERVRQRERETSMWGRNTYQMLPVHALTGIRTRNPLVRGTMIQQTGPGLLGSEFLFFLPTSP